MDPITCLGLAGAAVQFLDFTLEIIKEGWHIYRETGPTIHTDAINVTKELQDFTQKLELSLDLDNAVSTSPTPNELALQSLCVACSTLANEFVMKLESFRVSSRAEGKRRALKSFHQALLSVWRKNELSEYKKKLSGYRAAIDSRILACIRDRIDLNSFRQSKRFDDLDTQTQQIATTLFDFRDSISKDFDERMLALAQLINRREVILTGDSDPNKRILINALATASMPDESTRIITEASYKVRQMESEVMHRVAHDICDSLYFPLIRDRVDNIDDAHAKTFEWIFKEGHTESDSTLYSNFVEWLGNNDNLYWICGRAGSGKSTIMKYIHDHPRTMEHLRKWSYGAKLCCTSYFFWNSGGMIQKNQIGLLRSLLHDILRQLPELVPFILPTEWAREYPTPSHGLRKKNSDPWTLPTLLKAFKVLLVQVVTPIKLCIFIDGLDEYEGNDMDMADLFGKTIISPNIKICVSSRPHVAFTEVFGPPIPSLALHNLTRDDIRLYVDDRLLKDQKMKNLLSFNPEGASSLVSEIVESAHGVFLWVRIVVRTLLSGLSNRDRMNDLQRRLRELPDTLEALFDVMIRRVDKFYGNQASQIYQLVGEAKRIESQLAEDTGLLGVLELSFAQDEDRICFNTKSGPLAPDVIRSRCEDVDVWLKSRCGGLLEINNSELRSGKLYTVEIAAEMRIIYLHRTVRDYLEEKGTQLYLWKDRGSSFHPALSLTRAAIMYLKTAPPDPNLHLPHKQRKSDEQYWFLKGLLLAQSVGEENTPDLVELLDELGRCIKLPEDKMLWICIQSAIIPYVRYKLTAKDTIISMVHMNRLDVPILYFAIDPPLSDSFAGYSRLASHQNPAVYCPFVRKPEMVKTLLELGANPNHEYKRCSPWQLVMSTLIGSLNKWTKTGMQAEWGSIFVLFYQNGIDRKAKVKVEGKTWSVAQMVKHICSNEAKYGEFCTELREITKREGSRGCHVQ